MPVDPAAISNGMLELAESLKPIQEFLDGQRQDLCRRGYSAEAAEKIVVEIHAHVMWLLRGGGQK